MAKIFELNDLQRHEWDKWLKTRPLVIQEMATSHPPNRLYYHEPSKRRVTLISYSEDRTVSVAVTGQYNLVSMERSVFGIPIDELVECSLPSPDEPLGAVLTRDEAEAALAAGNTADERLHAVGEAAREKLARGYQPTPGRVERA